MPPYCPFLNPIENLFNQLKTYVKQANSKTKDQLFTAVYTSANRIGTENCENYFKNMLTYINRCLNKEEIEN